ncbi:hypothetical protein MK489_11935, partial [Myxococcota bacterium]|nr:hypothetical protein [Myxococcota bacterium]
ISPSLDAAACGFNIFASRGILAGEGTLSEDIPLAEVVSVGLAGDPAPGQGTLAQVVAQTSGGPVAPEMIPGVPLNRECPEIMPTGAGFGDRLSCILQQRNGYGTGRRHLGQAYTTIGNLDPQMKRPLTLDSGLSREQRALLGCGPFWGTRCDSSSTQSNPLTGDKWYDFSEGGGVDFLNMEASVLLQAFPGIEGTWTPGLNGYTPGGLWSALDRRLTQPGTVGFDGGPVATRYSADAPGGLVTLPGARGVMTPFDYEARGLDRATQAVTIDDSDPLAPVVQVEFQDGYDPLVDGCVFGGTLGGGPNSAEHTVVGRVYVGNATVPTPLTNQVEVWCGITRATTRFGNAMGPATQQSLAPQEFEELNGARTVFHPLAGCKLTDAEVAQIETASGQSIDPLIPCIQPYSKLLDVNRDVVTISPSKIGGDVGLLCGKYTLPLIGGDFECGIRDYETEYLESIRAGQAGVARNFETDRFSQVFRTELGAPSWNFLMLLVITSCSKVADATLMTSAARPDGVLVPDKEVDPSCFNANVIPETLSPDGKEYRANFDETRCSFAAPQFCRNVKSFLSVGGVNAPVLRAGGNGRFGRRTFTWHGGQEVLLRYDRRNVLGFSMDFAEDISKSNWGVEFTWIGDQPFNDGSRMDNISYQDTVNLTISVDRPTFINFMNANRTFFFNTQWFFQYQTGWNENYFNNGPFNVLFTFAMFTGYYQDRLLPNLITVYDFNSKSGAIIPTIAYRFTDVFTVEWGFLLFFGRTELKNMPINPIGPPGNSAGANYNKVPVDNLLSLVRHRDEVYMKLRYTF